MAKFPWPLKFELVDNTKGGLGRATLPSSIIVWDQRKTVLASEQPFDVWLDGRGAKTITCHDELELYALLVELEKGNG